MKIECSGPNGETFEGEAEFLEATNTGDRERGHERAKEHNELERKAVLEALDKWASVCLKALEQPQ